MNRRVFTKFTAGAILGISGCTGLGSSSKSDTSNSADQSDHTTTVHSNSSESVKINANQVDVSFGAVQPSIVELVTDRLNVPANDSQYLYVQVRTDGEDNPMPKSFKLYFNNNEYNSMNHKSLYRARLETPYDSSTGHGWLLYEIPVSGESTNTYLKFQDHRWEPSDSIRDQLASYPTDLSVRMSVPKTTPEKENPTISITVDNEDDRPGRFVAGLSRSGPSIASKPVVRISKRISASGQANISITDDTGMDSVSPKDLDDGEQDIRYYLNWDSGSEESAIHLVH